MWQGNSGFSTRSIIECKLMNKAHTGWMIAALALLLGGVVFAEAGKRAGKYAKGHVLVKFRADEVKRQVPDYRTRGMSGMAGRLGLPPGAKVRETQFGKWTKRRQGWAEDSAEDMSIFMYVDLPPGLSEDAALTQLAGNPMLEYVEKDAIGSAGATFPTNDPRYGDKQWFLQGSSSDVARIWAPEAWDITQGSSNIIVAVLDTGLDTGRYDFNGRWVTGWNFFLNNTNTMDDDLDGGHGTQVASILGSAANDGWNGVGVDWNCKIMPLKVLDENGEGGLGLWAEATYFAVSNGANVINLSAGSLSSNVTLEAAIKFAVSNGVTFVTIADNDGTNSVRFPGWMNETITVGGITRTGTLWSGSNWGTNLDLVAPCTNMFIVRSPSGVDPNAVGTSYAAPMVAGAASLLLAVDPTLSNDEVRDLLCGGADDQVSSDTNDLAGWDVHYGWGKLNIYNSLKLLQTELDTIVTTNPASTYLSWPCTQSATTNRPYKVQWTDDLEGGPWTDASNVTYTTGRAHWTGADGGSSNRFYRTFIKRYTSW